jgi:hypothetical protein
MREHNTFGCELVKMRCSSQPIAVASKLTTEIVCDDE